MSCKSIQSNRIQYELKTLQKEPIEGISAQPCGDDLTRWEATISGPDDTPYADSIMHLSIRIPSKYPFKPPVVRFKTKVYHPNIDIKSGDICVDVLSEQWSASLSIQKVLLSIRLLLTEPNVDDPYNVEAAEQYTENRGVFEMLAKQISLGQPVHDERIKRVKQENKSN